jgi:hypothetical protein
MKTTCSEIGEYNLKLLHSLSYVRVCLLDFEDIHFMRSFSQYSAGLEDRGSVVRFLEGAGNFSLNHRAQTGSGAHPASYPMGTRDSFPGGKAVGA